MAASTGAVGGSVASHTVGGRLTDGSGGRGRQGAKTSVRTGEGTTPRQTGQVRRGSSPSSSICHLWPHGQISSIAIGLSPSMKISMENTVPSVPEQGVFYSTRGQSTPARSAHEGEARDDDP